MLEGERAEAATAGSLVEMMAVRTEGGAEEVMWGAVTVAVAKAEVAVVEQEGLTEA